MTMNPSQLLGGADELEAEKEIFSMSTEFDRLKSMVRHQLEDAESNLAYAERQYIRAKKELRIAEESYARICADDPDELGRRRRQR
ncbi:hypothetical protein JUJ52_19700 [Virgibacillus sp. AGTR]|uniref:hypothetical protein n=1 Tax=Virgibacillus sp. AGTR TaxID=2812055 RepID=UPI001D1614B8|nr:hypothetical protein [Virgibacillus sp. AGTR]MCC2252158.1 hypothetical protein [Virgibacillus sp. AGTR]